MLRKSIDGVSVDWIILQIINMLVLILIYAGNDQKKMIFVSLWLIMVFEGRGYLGGGGQGEELFIWGVSFIFRYLVNGLI